MCSEYPETCAEGNEASCSGIGTDGYQSPSTCIWDGETCFDKEDLTTVCSERNPYTCWADGLCVDDYPNGCTDIPATCEEGNGNTCYYIPGCYYDWVSSGCLNAPLSCEEANGNADACFMVAERCEYDFMSNTCYRYNDQSMDESMDEATEE